VLYFLKLCAFEDSQKTSVTKKQKR